MNAITSLRRHSARPPLTRMRTLMLREVGSKARLSRGVDFELVVSESLCILCREGCGSDSTMYQVAQITVTRSQTEPETR